MQVTIITEDMLKERRFDRAFIVAVVCNPERKKSGAGGVWYALRRVGDKVVRVVVNSKEKRNYSGTLIGRPIAIVE